MFKQLRLFALLICLVSFAAYQHMSSKAENKPEATERPKTMSTKTDLPTPEFKIKGEILEKVGELKLPAISSTLVELSNHQILIASRAEDAQNKFEIYDPKSNSSRVITLGFDHINLVKLNDKDDLLIFGKNLETNKLSYYIFNPLTSATKVINSAENTKVPDTLTLLNDGTVLIGGGYSTKETRWIGNLELFNAKTNTILELPSKSIAKSSKIVTKLSDGTIYFAGELVKSGQYNKGVIEYFDSKTKVINSLIELNEIPRTANLIGQSVLVTTVSRNIFLIDLTTKSIHPIKYFQECSPYEVESNTKSLAGVSQSYVSTLYTVPWSNESVLIFDISNAMKREKPDKCPSLSIFNPETKSITGIGITHSEIETFGLSVLVTLQSEVYLTYQNEVYKLKRELIHAQ